MINIVIPMAGRGSRFADHGFLLPKPLIDLGGRPIIHWVINNLRPKFSHRFIFICLKDHLDHYPQLENSLKRVGGDNTIVISVNSVTQGAACTVLLAKEHINDENPLMIANSDQIVDVDIDNYLSTGVATGIDGFIMCFNASDPKWSYCLVNQGRVVEVVEKKVVSDKATVGIYNFKRGRDYVRSVEAMIALNMRVNGEFYVAPTYNILIREDAVITYQMIPPEGVGMFGLGTPEDYHKFKMTDYFNRTR